MLKFWALFLIALIAQSSAWDFGRDGHDGNHPSWRNWGVNDYNWRAQLYENRIGVNNVASIVQLWNFTAGGMSASPTTSGQDNYLYQTDWQGGLYALDRFNGTLYWSFNVSAFILNNVGANPVTPVAELASRSSPSIDGDRVYITTRAGAFLIALNRFSGNVIWSYRVDTHPAAVITSSPRVYEDKIYVGVASVSEVLDSIPGYPCCTFRGRFAAVNRNGSLAWQFFTVPDNGGVPGGWAGGAIWSSLAPIDEDRNMIFVSTGNAYQVPYEVQACQNLSAANTATIFSDPCHVQGDYTDSVVALDLTTGFLRWSRSFGPLDVWTTACGVFVNGIAFIPPNPAECPPNYGPDADFGQSPILVKNPSVTPQGLDTLYVCQKSGMCWALSAEAGTVLWSTRGGPDGGNGGMSFGSATDGQRLFYASVNSGLDPHLLTNGQTINTGSWGAMNLTTGQIIWQLPYPYTVGTQVQLLNALTYANGVLYSGSLDFLGTNGGWAFAIDAVVGSIIWNQKLDSKVVSSPSVVDGIVYFPAGYASDGGLFNPPYRLYALGLPWINYQNDGW